MTRLGETIVEHVIVEPGGRVGEHHVVETARGFALYAADGSELALPARLPCGLGTMTISSVARSTTELAHRPIERPIYALVTASLAAHLAILALAMRPNAAPVKPPGRTRGTSQARLVANHATATRARRDPVVVHSPLDQDQPELHRELTQGHAIAAKPSPHAPIVRERDDVVGHATSPGLDNVEQSAARAARHFDPCANGDCGLIATSRDYATKQERVGDDYQLPPREPRALETAVVTCDIDGGCNTASGTDDSAVRTALSHHLTEIYACFDGHTEVTAAIDARVDSDGSMHVSAHDPNEVSACIAQVAEKLKLASGERNVTLAFARDH
ncbi:MAG TPA: hypothetical protein VGG28_24820 [Kofleriaceae bacterium]